MSAPRPEGSFCWFELATSDVPRALAFYGAVFGWRTLGDDPAAPGAFVKWTLDGEEFGAVYALEGERPGGVSRHWLSYVKVRDAERMAVRVVELGGRVRFGPMDAGPFGRMLYLEDPSGAHLGLWQPLEHAGAPVLPPSHGAPCWVELATRDAEAARAFYRALFDWTAKDSGDESQAYTEFASGGRTLAGMLEMDERWGGAPPHWLPYFAVDDCVDAAGRIVAAGGTVCVGPKPIPGVGVMGVATDPDGAPFAVIALGARA